MNASVSAARSVQSVVVSCMHQCVSVEVFISASKKCQWWSSHRGGWLQDWPGDGLHPLSPVYTGTCAAVLTAPSRILIIQALPQASHFLLPARFIASVCVWWGNLHRHPGQLLPPPCRFPTHRAPPGSGQWPRRQDLNTHAAFLLSHLRFQTNTRALMSQMDNTGSSIWPNKGDRPYSENCLLMASFKRKKITKRQSYSGVQPTVLGSAQSSASSPITLSDWYSLAETPFSIGEKKRLLKRGS